MATSTRSGGTFASEAFTGTTDAWSSPSNAAASDDADASAAVTTLGDISEYLKCTNFGFSLPTNATVQGIEVLVEWAGRTSVFETVARQHRCRIIKGGTISSDTTFDASTSLPTSDTVTTIGTSSSLWGTTWTAADINSSSFGVAISVKAAASGSPGTATIDHVQIRVTYNPTTQVVTETEGPVPGSIVSVSGDDVELAYGVAFTPGQSPASLNNRVRSISVRRGRSGALDRVNAGVADCRLTNTDGELDPSNASGSYYGSILPLRDVYVYRRISDTTYWLHRGRAERYVMEWVPPTVQFTGVESADAFELLSTRILKSDQATLTTALTGTNNDLTFTAREAGASGEAITVEYVVAGNNTALSVVPTDPLQAAAIITAIMSEPKTKSRQRWIGGPTGPTVPVTVTLSGSNIAVNVATDGSGNPTSTASQIKTALEADPNVRKLVTVSLAAGNDGTGVVTAMPQTALSGGTWPQEPSGARINRVLDLVGWPAALRDIDTGTYDTVAKGFGVSDNVSALAHILDVAESELGYVFVRGDGTIVYHDGQHRAVAERSTVSQATFSDDGTGIPFTTISPQLDKDRIWNSITVTGGSSTSLPQTVEDTDSQAAYGLRSMSRSTLLASDDDALEVATALLASYAEPQMVFDEITLIRTDDVAGWDAAVLGREIGDLVTIRTNPPAHDSSVSYEAFIEEIKVERVVGQPWRATFRLTSASQSSTPGGGGGGGVGGGALLALDGGELVLDTDAIA